MKRKFLLLLTSALLLAVGADAQSRKSAASPSVPQFSSPTRMMPQVSAQPMQMLAPGVPAPARAWNESLLLPFYRRPAGAYYCTTLAINGEGGYILDQDFVLFKPYADYTLYSTVVGSDQNTHYAWNVFHGSDGNYTRVENVKDLSVTYNQGTQPMPIFYAYDGPLNDPSTKRYWYQYPYGNVVYDADGYPDVVEPTLPPAEAWAIPNADAVSGAAAGTEYLLSSKTASEAGRNGDQYTRWMSFYGATPSPGNAHGWWFGKNGSHIDGMAQIFEKPEHPYQLNKVYMWIDQSVECSASVPLFCSIYKLTSVEPYDDEYSTYLPEVPGEPILVGVGEITPITGISKYGMVEFTLYGFDEDDPDVVYEYSPTVDYPIMVAIDGYNDPDASALKSFTAFISSDYHVDEGYGELAYLKYPITDSNGNFTGRYMWRGLNNFFSLGEMKTGLSIFIVADQPFIAFDYDQEDGEYNFPAEGGVMRQEFVDDGNATIQVEGIQFLSSFPVENDDWMMYYADSEELPDWLDITLEDIDEVDAGYVVKAHVSAEPLPEGLDYREATVKFEIPGDYKYYKFIQGEKIGPVVPPEITIAFVNQVIDCILSDDYDPIYDFDKDGSINIADVNQVIDYILSH